MIVSVAVGKAGHTGAHISPASCTDLACPAFWPVLSIIILLILLMIAALTWKLVESGKVKH